MSVHHVTEKPTGECRGGVGVGQESLKGLPVEWPISQGTDGSAKVCEKWSPAFCSFPDMIRSFLVVFV